MARRIATLRSSSPSPEGAETVTFAYVDPGRESTGELNTWGATHVPLWDAIRAKGRQVRVVAIAAEHEPIERADRVLRAWAAAPEKDGTGMTVKKEIAAIKDGVAAVRSRIFGAVGRVAPGQGAVVRA